MVGNILSLFHKISLSHEDGKKSPKVDAIQNFFTEYNIKSEFIPEVGIVVNKVKNPRLILVSHFDLINRFNKAFTEGEYQLELYEKNEKKYIQGALDNTITNSVAMIVMKELLESGIDDVELILTEQEEVGMHGMRRYINKFKEKSKSSFFINLDVTNEGWNSKGSLEYDRPSAYMVKELQKIVSKKVFFTHYRVCDDIDAVNSAGMAGFSFCLPTDKTIHSLKNRTTEKMLNDYYFQLRNMLIKLTPTDKKDETESGYALSDMIDALDYDDYLEIKEQIKKERENKYKNNYKSYSEPKNYHYHEIDDEYDNFEDSYYGSLFEEDNEKKTKTSGKVYIDSNYSKYQMSESEIVQYVQDIVDFEFGTKGSQKERDTFFEKMYYLTVIDRSWKTLKEMSDFLEKDEKETLKSMNMFESVGILKIKGKNKEFLFYEPTPM